MLCQSLCRDVFYRLRALWITSRAMLSFGDQLFFALNFRALAATPSPLHHVLALSLVRLVHSRHIGSHALAPCSSSPPTQCSAVDLSVVQKLLQAFPLPGTFLRSTFPVFSRPNLSSTPRRLRRAFSLPCAAWRALGDSTFTSKPKVQDPD